MTAEPTLPRISIVTPSFNQGRFLEECIVSVLNQGYPRLEYIVIDGGSTDASLEIIRRYQDRFSFWVSERDGGQADGINKGFGRATGDLVAWLNSDDFYLPGALMRIAEAYQKNPDASFYFGNGLRVDSAGRTLASFFPDDRIVFRREALLHGLNYILQPATAISRRHLLTAGDLDSELRYGLDTDLWLRLSALTEPQPVPFNLAASREYGETKTASGAFPRVEELRRIAERHSGIGMTPGALCYLLDTLTRLAEERPDVYPPSFRRDIAQFWQATSALLERHGARADGFPSTNLHPPAGEVRPAIAGRLWRRLRTFWPQ
jgi:hypothetical protein